MTANKNKGGGRSVPSDGYGIAHAFASSGSRRLIWWYTILITKAGYNSIEKLLGGACFWARYHEDSVGLPWSVWTVERKTERGCSGANLCLETVSEQLFFATTPIKRDKTAGL